MSKISSRSLIVFVAIAFIFSFFAVSTHAQTWQPPVGAPPENNVAPPIHEGSAGQAKYWNSVAAYSLGSLYNLVEGLLSAFTVADGEGVAATQYCLIPDPQAFEDSGYDFSTLPADACVSDWGQIAGLDGVDGVDGDLDDLYCSVSEQGDAVTIQCPNQDAVTITPSGLPAGGPGSTLWYNSQTSEWEVSNLVRSVDGAPEVNVNDKIFLGFKTIGQQDPASVEIFGSFRYRTPQDPNDPNFYVGKVLGGALNGSVVWQELASLLPGGTSAGQIMYWNQVDGEWNVSTDSGFLEGLGFVANYTNGKKFSYLDNNGSCPEFNTIAIENGFGGILKDLNCTDELRVNTTESKVYVKSLEHNADNERPVCAQNDGELTLCTALSMGDWSATQAGTYEFEVPFGIYEIEVTAIGAGGGGGAGGLGRSLGLIYPQDNNGNFPYADDIMAGGGGGGGGGRGETTIETFSVEPGQVYTVSVGAGGRGGCPDRQSPGTWWGPNYCGDASWNVNGSSPFSGQGESGDTTSFFCANQNECDTGNSLQADGGNGGVLGGTIWSINAAADITTYNILGVLGGGPGSNADGTVTANTGNPGEVYETNPNNEDPDGAIVSCDNSWDFGYLFTYPGGNGGEGSDGASGGAGGPLAIVPQLPTPFPWNGLICEPFTFGFSGHGGNGVTGTISGSGGGGGGGGNSQFPGPAQPTTGYGYGGRGGSGASGAVFISW